MEKNICYIIGAGENFGLDINLHSGDYVIAVDGGYEYAKTANLPLDIVVGDFDSLGYIPKRKNTIALPPEKDDTDSLYAVKLGLEKGYKIFYFYCCSGGRIAHTLANIQVLTFLAKQGCQGFLFGKLETMTVICNGKMKFDKNKKGLVSIFSCGNEAKGVTLKNLKYPLINYNMTNFYPIGVSNEFIGEKSEVEVQSGELLIIYTNN